jgi:7,8-dihydropterin-6-yl-methyl-4-(beta-D-ribofuranosyl)aminobenzene 5'-phosphate synthase
MAKLHGVLGILIVLLTASPLSAQKVRDLKITVLSTMLSDRYLGEWGFAAWVEADGRKILFDTGARPDTVLANSRELKIDLSQADDVVLSHSHGDHTGGLITLRREAARTRPAALGRVWVAQGFFYPRLEAGSMSASVARLKTDYAALGGRFEEIAAPKQLQPGVWLTGPIPRKHPERNWSGSGKLRRPDGTEAEDNLPEDMALVFDTGKGLIVLTGCGHAGIINTVDYARSAIRSAPVPVVLGGIHLFNASDETLAWTAARMKEAGVQQMLGAHCTGIESTFRLRQLLGLDRASAPNASVGAVYTLDKLDPGVIAR